jgi:hypothetical protein
VVDRATPYRVAIRLVTFDCSCARKIELQRIEPLGADAHSRKKREYLRLVKLVAEREEVCRVT